jgi:hypothetical protein
MMNIMNKFFLLFVLLLLAAGSASAEQSFLIKNASKIFDVKIKIANCEDDVCDDKATVYLLKKNQTKIFQTIEMEEMYLRLETGRTLDGSPVEIKKEEISGLSFADFNFDGAEDLEIGNGMYAPYGGISSDVFLFSESAGKFVENAVLSALAAENMSLDINRKLKYIEAFTKSGCCWHQTTRYKFVGSRLVKIYVMTEDAARGDEKVEITTARLVGKRWKKSTKIALIKDYYDEH